MKQVCKTRKIRKTLFVSLLNFCIKRCGNRSWRLQRRFKQVSKYEFAVRRQSNLHIGGTRLKVDKKKDSVFPDSQCMRLQIRISKPA